MVQLQHVAPQDIERESFRLIEAELGPTTLPPREFQVLRRIIHATGDFSFAENIRFHPLAIDAGLEAIRTGKNILVDVNMAASGVSTGLLAPFGGQVVCHINEQKTAQMAQEAGSTRSEAAVLRAQHDNIGIVAVGNAPTALLKVMELIDQGQFKPALVVGVPVGFVNAAESKELLSRADYPFITTLGRKGGTPVAVATLNALLRLATTA